MPKSLCVLCFTCCKTNFPSGTIVEVNDDILNYIVLMTFCCDLRLGSVISFYFAVIFIIFVYHEPIG